MNHPTLLRTASLLLACAGSAMTQHSAIDAQKSVMTVRVFRAGAFSAFGHDHEISAPIAGGTVDVAGHKVELRANAKSLRVHASPGSLCALVGQIEEAPLEPWLNSHGRRPYGATLSR